MLITTESILIVDDDEAMCWTLAVTLGSDGYETETALSGKDALEKARERLFSLALVDIRLPDMSGLDLLASLRDVQPDLVPVILTGYASVESAVEALSQGAAAYVTKPFRMDEALATVRLGVQRHRMASEKRRAQQALRESEERYRLVARATFNAIWDWDLTSSRVQWSPGVETLFGYSLNEVDPDLNWWKERIHPEDRQRVESSIYNVIDGDHEIWREEYRFRRRDGSYSVVMDRGFVVRDRESKPVRMVGAMMDVTEKRRLEEQMHQKSRLEAVGKLAGGMAHDFNNLLTGVKGYIAFVLDRFDENSPVHQDLAAAAQLVDSAAGLTREFLAFSRRQPIELVVLNINALVENVAKMLQRLIGEDIDFAPVLAQDLGSVRADPGQIEQVLLNLAVNARDAMPKGGSLRIETANVTLGEAYVRRHVGASPGPHVMLTVTDTGCGMDQETQRRAFEPFFTTKDEAKGSGLGLATAYGIVTQHGGDVWVYSELGRGTCVKVYLPRVDEEAVALAAAPQKESLARGTETIFIAEDDEAVRAIAERILKGQGYTILSACSPDEAEHLLSDYEGEVDLLLTDVVMPGANGRELYDSVKAIRPSLKVLYTSGYTDDSIVHNGILDPGTPFLQKPFERDQLLREVREVLDA